MSQTMKPSLQKKWVLSDEAVREFKLSKDKSLKIQHELNTLKNDNVKAKRGNIYLEMVDSDFKQRLKQTFKDEGALTKKERKEQEQRDREKEEYRMDYFWSLATESPQRKYRNMRLEKKQQESAKK